MKDSVVAPDAISYERTAKEEEEQQQRETTSERGQLYRYRTLAIRIEEHLAKNGTSMRAV